MRDSQDKRYEEGEITGGNLGGKLFCTRPYLILVQAFNCRIDNWNQLYYRALVPDNQRTHTVGNQGSMTDNEVDKQQRDLQSTTGNGNNNRQSALETRRDGKQSLPK